jgi:hypothetical protein
VRWQQEKARLVQCPSSDYDTSIKLYRKVYKDCMISYNASLYQVPPDVVGKKGTLRGTLLTNCTKIGSLLALAIEKNAQKLC